MPAIYAAFLGLPVGFCTRSSSHLSTSIIRHNTVLLFGISSLGGSDSGRRVTSEAIDVGDRCSISDNSSMRIVFTAAFIFNTYHKI